MNFPGSRDPRNRIPQIFLVLTVRPAACLQAAGVLADSDLARVFKMADKDGSGDIDYAEYEVRAKSELSLNPPCPLPFVSPLAPCTHPRTPVAPSLGVPAISGWLGPLVALVARR